MHAGYVLVVVAEGDGGYGRVEDVCRVVADADFDEGVEDLYISVGIMVKRRLMEGGGTVLNPPTGYHIPSVISVYCSREYVAGASNGLIPRYILANVNAWRSLSE